MNAEVRSLQYAEDPRPQCSVPRQEFDLILNWRALSDFELRTFCVASRLHGVAYDTHSPVKTLTLKHAITQRSLPHRLQQHRAVVARQCVRS